MRHLVLTVLLAGCASSPSTPSVGAPVVARSAPVAAAAADAMQPETAADCPLTMPDEVAARASVQRVPKELYERAFGPVLRALCACTKSGERVDVRAEITPRSGEVRARAPDRTAVQACLARRLDPGVFEPFDLDEPSCPDCGPRRVATPLRPARIAAFRASQGESPAPTKAAPPPAAASAPLEVPFSYEHALR
jgi:hypothetical protein